MTNVPPRSASLAAFAMHLGGAGLLLALFITLTVQTLLAPVDLFVHRSLTATYDLVLFAVWGLVFYGFSLALLRLRPLSVGWGAVYAGASWVLFVLAFFPTRPTGGMMRRTADLADYETLRRSVHDGFTRFSLGVLLAFALVQVVFLRHVLRSPAVAGPDSLPSSS